MWFFFAESYIFIILFALKYVFFSDYEWIDCNVCYWMLLLYLWILLNIFLFSSMLHECFQLEASLCLLLFDLVFLRSDVPELGETSRWDSLLFQPLCFPVLCRWCFLVRLIDMHLTLCNLACLTFAILLLVFFWNMLGSGLCRDLLVLVLIDDVLFLYNFSWISCLRFHLSSVPCLISVCL